MALYVVLGILLLIFAMYAGRWYASANPTTLVQVLKWGAVGLVGVAGGYLALTGRLGWALFAAPMLVPLFRRARILFRGGTWGTGGATGTSDPFEGIGSPGNTSEVRTQFVRVVLDHDSGEMNGEVLAGQFKGRMLRTLSLDDLLALLGEARGDENSAQVLTAYLERYHGEAWRDAASARGGNNRSDDNQGATPRSGTMTREEALEVLGLAPGADAAAIKAAHHRLMSKIHPDLGGSTYLAAKINQAKDILLGT
jgi:hypothetical protein